MFNLNIHPINIFEGKHNQTLPGLFALTPPRKCARGRESDLLVGLVQLTGQTSITADALQDWLLKKATLFYKTPGTVTSAMRAVAEAINSDLLDRNIKKAKGGSQVNGSLCLSVIRKNIVYLLIVGQAHVFILGGEDAVEFEDAENHPRGLGVNETVLCRFYQTEVSDNSAILFAPQPNIAWSMDALRGGAVLSLEALTRRIFNQAPSNLKGALIRLTPGSGQIIYQALHYSGTATDILASTRAMDEPPGNEGGEKPFKPDFTNTETLAKSDQIPAGAMSEISADQTELPFKVEARKQAGEGQTLRETRTPSATERRMNRGSQQKQETGSTVAGDEIKAQLGSYVQAVDNFQSATRKGIKQLIGKLFPGKEEESQSLPRSVLLITAIIVPILVVALASSVYIRKGKSQQFELYFLQGQQYAIQAENLKDDPVSRLTSLQQALYFLEKAAQFGQNDASNALLSQIQKEVDAMEGVVRWNLVPISSIGLPGNVMISQMAATATDLYLLDETSGRALRFYLSGAEYIQDMGFDCGPNPQNPLSTVGKLVDMIPLSSGNAFKATLFAIDVAGNIEFCSPGESGSVGSLIPPDAGWRSIRAISIFQNYLYVLDTEGNAVYRYREVENSYGEKPTLFFDSTVPPLQTAIDIEVNGDELYILRSSGEMVECTYSHIKDYKLTECVDPAPYGDMRTGQSPQPISFPNAQFTQMRMTAAPDSSLYLLDANGKSVYHFSLQRNLQKILNPRFADEGSILKNVPTAIAVSPGKIAFVAYGNQIFYAPLP